MVLPSVSIQPQKRREEEERKTTNQTNDSMKVKNQLTTLVWTGL